MNCGNKSSSVPTRTARLLFAGATPNVVLHFNHYLNQLTSTHSHCSSVSQHDIAFSTCLRSDLFLSLITSRGVTQVTFPYCRSGSHGYKYMQPTKQQETRHPYALTCFWNDTLDFWLPVILLIPCGLTRAAWRLVGLRERHFQISYSSSVADLTAIHQWWSIKSLNPTEVPGKHEFDRSHADNGGPVVPSQNWSEPS